MYNIITFRLLYAIRFLNSLQGNIYIMRTKLNISHTIYFTMINDVCYNILFQFGIEIDFY